MLNQIGGSRCGSFRSGTCVFAGIFSLYIVGDIPVALLTAREGLCVIVGEVGGGSRIGDISPSQFVCGEYRNAIRFSSRIRHLKLMIAFYLAARLPEAILLHHRAAVLVKIGVCLLTL